MEKINLVEILKDCPYGMELYSPLCGDCKLYDVNDYSIRIETPNKDTLISLYHDGRYCSGGKIMIFPKGKTTWEGFVPPCKFKNGDIIYIKDKYNQEWCSILSNDVDNKLYTYIDFYINYSILYYNKPNILCEHKYIIEYRLAAEEEKQKLFNAIKANGYKWNAETKTLEKLLKFKVGDRVKSKITQYNYTIVDIRKDVYIMYYETDKFGYHVPFCNEDNYELVLNKFDITTLKPFDKVLVRDNNAHKWTIDFFGFINEYKRLPFVCVRDCVTQCIPYEGNEHLLGTIDDCPEYYKTWK